MASDQTTAPRRVVWTAAETKAGQAMRLDGLRAPEIFAILLKDRVLEHEAAIERLNAICREYEEGGFNGPGRAIDDIRDVLGRRG